MKEKFLKDSVFSFFSSGVAKVLVLITNVLIAKFYGAEKLGRYNYVLSFVMIFVPICTLGIDQGLIKFIPKNNVSMDKTKNDHLIAFSFLSSIAISLGLFLLINSFSQQISFYLLGDIKYQELLTILSFVLLLITIEMILAAVLRGNEKNVPYLVITNILRPVLFLSLLIILFYSYQIQNQVALVRVLSYSSAFIIYIFLVLKGKILFMPSKEYIQEYKDLVKFSVPLMLLGLTYILSDKVNILMLGRTLSDASVGIYSAALQISLVLGFVLQSINQIYMPRASKLFHENKLGSIQNMYSKITILLTATTVIIMLAILIFKSPIMGVFGDEFIQGSGVLVVLAIGQSVNSITGPCGSTLIVYGFSKYNLITNVVLFALIILFNLFLIPRLGYIGAAYSVAMAIAISNMIKVIFMYKKTNILPFKFIKSEQL